MIRDLSGRQRAVAVLLAATVAAVVLFVLDFGYGVPWLIRAPLALTAAHFAVDMLHEGRLRWHERARRNRLRE